MRNFILLVMVLALSFTLVSCAHAADASDAVNNYESLAKLCEKHGFKLGSVINYNQLSDAEYLKLMAKHFNSLTAGNEFKAYSLLNQNACRKAEDGMPVMNFFQADQIIAWAQRSGIQMRGHVLVWDAYMPDWFLREGYQNGQPFVDAETMKLRLQSYIEQVITHFEEKYPGVIYAWDVVNEAIGDSAADWDASDARHIRTTRGGVSNVFRDVLGNDYIALAFLYARDTIEKIGADIKLYYNDYNMFQPGKRDSACELIKSINAFAKDDQGEYRRLVDGVGMQGYIGGYGSQAGCMNNADIGAIKTAIQTYAALGMEVQITEMAVRSYEGGEDVMQKHGQFYQDLFKMFCSVNEGEEKPLTAVCIWGPTDINVPQSNYNYKQYSPYGGLFTLDYGVKPAFQLVYDFLNQ